MKSTVMAWMVTMSLGWPGAAPVWADADEASVHAGPLVGAVSADTVELGPVTVAPAAGLSGKLTYAISDWYAFETVVEFEHSAGMVSFDGPEPGRYPDANDPDANDQEDVEFKRSLGWVRGEAGISLRLGVRWIPTVHAGMGLQVQRAGQAREFRQEDTLPGRGSEMIVGVAGVIGVGLDYRLDEHWVIGAGVRVRHSLPWGWYETYSAASMVMQVGYYWYPGNMAR